MIFVLDTNVLWARELPQLATAARRHGHRVEVPALAYAERLAQRRRQLGEAFDSALFEAFFLTHEFQVVPFDQAIAERCAESLAGRYPKKEHWHDARRARCAFRFRMVQDSAGETCPATIDWYLAAPYPAPYVFVTGDNGSEFAGTGAVRLDQAIRLAEVP